MPSKYQIISELAVQKAAEVSSGAKPYMAFLETAAANYKYSFKEQLLIYAQRPDATALAEIGTWNKLGRWVNKGAKGIALLVENDPKNRLRHVFDISDTNSYYGNDITPWKMKASYEDAVIEALRNRFGEITDYGDFAESISGIADLVVEDNISDYAEMLEGVKGGSLLEELDEDNTSMWLKTSLKNSVAFMMLTRCGYNARRFFSAEDFSRVYDFNTPDTIAVLGGAASDISEMAIREIEATVRALDKEERKRIRTFAITANESNNVAETQNNERSTNDGADLQTGGRLSPSEPQSTGSTEDWEIWNAAARVPTEEQRPDIHRDVPKRNAEQSPGGDGQESERDAGEPDDADGEERGSDGEPEIEKSDALGTDDEQYPESSRGDSSDRAHLQLSGHDFNGLGGLPYYHAPDNVNEFIRTSDAISEHRTEIAAFFASHEDSRERGDFIRAFFDGEQHEHILESGEIICGQAYQDVLQIWPKVHDRERWLKWNSVASHIYGMILMDEWLDPDEKTLPTVEEQMSFIAEAQAEKKAGFTIPQEAIDYVLTRGSGIHEGKYRIYEQFLKNETSEQNVKFLKNEYGIGGHSDAIPGTAIWEDHDGKGIALKKGDDSIVLSWPKVAKRISELIAADRYLNSAEKAYYETYKEKQAERDKRKEIAQEFNAITREFNEFVDSVGEEEKELNLIELSGAAAAFVQEEKRIYRINSDGNFVLPIMREAMNAVISEKSYLTERAKAMLEYLSSDVAKPMEPTFEELNPPPPPKKDYVLPLGSTIYIGAQEYELLSYGEDEVSLYDPSFPLMNKELSRSDFDRMLRENPLNDKYLQVVEKAAEPELPEAEPKPRGNELWQKYSRVKAENAGYIVLIQVGDFYEALGDDAKTVADALDLQLATRNVGLDERVPMCGIPTKNVETAVNLLQDRILDVILVDDKETLYPLPADHKAVPVETRPVGRIDYLGTDGRVGYSTEYTEEDRFVRDILDDNHYGVPMSIVVYRDKNGNTISQDFVNRLDPPPQGYKVVDYEKVRPEYSIDRAKKLIDEYCEREFGAPGDYTDLTSVGLGYTELEEENIPVEISVNLVDCRLERYLDKKLVDVREYDSIEDLIENELEGLDFAELTAFDDETIEKAKQSYPGNEARQYIDHYYVIPDLEVNGQLDITNYETFEDAFAAYNLLPKDKLKAFGVQNTNQMPGSLDFIHCRNGKDTLVEDYKKENGWNNAEITELVTKLNERINTELSAPKQTEKRRKLAPELIYPEIPQSQRIDFRIENDDIGVGTPLDRFYRNIRAIQLLKKLENEHRLATPTEQGAMAEYVGWGGLSQFFEEDNPHYGELKSVLTDDEYASARESSLTAFYTPPVVIRAMYKALENMGFKSGNILEPSCGVGNFMGMKPESLADSRVFGVELDSISGRIARQLYQKSSIAVQGFEKTELPDSFFDVAIGNVPFGDFKLSDKRYDKHNFLIHDYFFAKTLDKVRPGGIIAFITSKGTMDKENPNVRKYIAQRADLLGAIRLPNNTFKNAAGTDVTSDILFLQKRDTLTAVEPSWVHLNVDSNGIKMNEYFVENPDMIMGEMRVISGPFGPETACIAYDGQDLDEMLSEAIQNITGNISEYEIDEPQDNEVDNSIPADPSVRNFSYTLVDGALYYRENSRMVPVDISVTGANRIKGMMAIRDCVRQLIFYQTEDYPDSMVDAEQKKRNELYNDFSAKYGIINSRANRTAFTADNSFFLLSSLEVLDDEGNFLRKADMFTKRTIKPNVEITHVDTASEALAVSLAEKAKVDMDFMSELTGKSEEELYNDLKGVVFLNPLYGFGNSTEAKYVPADEYLSGNVREKLRWAKRSAELYPDEFGINAEALEKVQPVDLPASEISVRIGATWITPEDYERFMFELFNTPRYAQWNIHIHYSQYTGEWNIEGKTYDRVNVKANSTFGTDRINGYKIIEQTLNLKDVRIYDYIDDGEGKRVQVLNKKETAIAQGKQEMIKQAFQDWIWKDPERRERLTRAYNEKFNAIRTREYDGSHLSLTGINPEIKLRQHQLNAVARGLYGGNELLGHVVGAGKTYTMVAIAQESKRLGLCNKSLFVVPNHLTEQWAAEYLQLYPSANVLVATAKDFEAKNRKRFCGRIATGDYDAVIIGHSQLEKIPLSSERQQYMLQEQLDEILEGINELKKNRGERFSIKQLEKAKKQVQTKLDKLNDQSRKDDVVTFEELGVDKLFIDEAHYYKNLAAFTKMRNVGGISQTEAQKSSDLYMKCRYLDELTGGKGVVFATGTPISNTMVEMYTMQKYLQYNTLKRNDLIHFDSWASTFGETVTAIELAPEGTGYRAKTRFAKFYNLPELMSMFKETADIQTADMLNLPVPKANYHNVVLKPSEAQKEMVASLAERAERVRSGMVNSAEDNMLVITNDGRKLALDQRLMNEMLPESDTGKVNACADNVFNIWQRTADKRSTQMIFCDLSTPHNDGHFNVYDAIRDKLIAKGISAEEIAFIHGANTEVKKKELFGKVRSGQIRVLIGSTQKMGAGTNVQQKLIALHHLDCPWRPADLQQREGRIVRQGNENPEVEIYTYVTENTFDSYLYQLVESKQKFIGQIMTSKSPVRSAEDIDETALSYAEIKALCSGNPQIKEKMDLDVVVAKLKLLKANHLSQKYALEDQILKDFPQKIAALEQRIEGYNLDNTRLSENTNPNEEGFSPMTVDGTVYTDKKAAGSAILEICQHMTNPAPIAIGEYRGFTMSVYFETLSREYRLNLHGALTHQIALGTDIYGNIQRMDNVLSLFEDRRKACEAELDNVMVQFANAKIEVEKPFPQEDELREKQARLDELNISLNMDKRENEVVDSEREDEEIEREISDRVR